MPISRNELADIVGAIEATFSNNKLDAWQTKFLKNMEAKLKRYGADTRLSQKQEAKLRELVSPYIGAHVSNVISLTQTPLRDSQNAVHGRKRGKPKKTSRKFFKPPRFRKRVPHWWIYSVVVLILMAFFNEVGWSNLTQPRVTMDAHDAGWVSNLSFTITDGDTIKLSGRAKGTRLVGFNTPETYKPRCDAEQALGRKATSRLKQLVSEAETVDLQLVACACQEGTQGTDACNFGRSCGVLKVDGVDVARTLIKEGLAVPYVCGTTSCPKPPRPWCE